MESTLSLQSNLYPKVTPAGAYYAVTSDTPSASRTLLYSLLKASPTEVISSEKILAWADTSDINTALNFCMVMKMPVVRIYILLTSNCLLYWSNFQAQVRHYWQTRTDCILQMRISITRLPKSWGFWPVK